MTALIGRLLGCGFEADTVTTPLQGLKSPTDAPILALRVVVTSAGLLIGPPVGEHEPDGRVPTLPHFILQGGRQPMMIGGPSRGAAPLSSCATASPGAPGPWWDCSE